jgi:uncharacterized membrane protein YidH (DUF202 family)
MAAATPPDPKAAPPDPKATPPAEWAGAKPPRPNLTVPQVLSFLAFLVFVVLALFAKDDPGATIGTDELKEVGTFTMFLIGAMLPSDALIRFGRNLLFQTVEDADAKAKYAPATTLAQMLAFGAFVVIVLATIFKEVSGEEFKQVIDVGRVLVVALLPSDAGIRFGRALYFRSDSTPKITLAQLKKV